MLERDDIISVASDLGHELTDTEIAEALSRYPFEQEQDPSGTWDLVVEKIIDDLLGER